MNKQELIMNQLLQHVTDVCKKNDINVFISLSIEEKTDVFGLCQTASHMTLGKEGAVLRLAETSIKQSVKFRTIILKALEIFKKKQAQHEDVTLN